VTSIGPVLLIVVAVAGLFYGEEAARGALMAKFDQAMGPQSAGFLQLAIGSASNHSSGIIATLIGVVSLVVTASGVFGEMQTALNAIWRTNPEGGTVERIIKARLTSLTLVVTLGFLLLVSLVLGAAIAAIGQALDNILPFTEALLHLLKLRGFAGLPECDLRSDLQDPAGPASRMARHHCWRAGDRFAHHDRQTGDRYLYRPQRHCLQLWRCRVSPRVAAVGLLLGADIPVRCRVHPSLRGTSGPGTQPGAAWISSGSLRLARSNPRIRPDVTPAIRLS
jgi:hypothetical protein